MNQGREGMHRGAARQAPPRPSASVCHKEKESCCRAEQFEAGCTQASPIAARTAGRRHEQASRQPARSPQVIAALPPRHVRQMH